MAIKPLVYLLAFALLATLTVSSSPSPSPSPSPPPESGSDDSITITSSSPSPSPPPQSGSDDSITITSSSPSPSPSIGSPPPPSDLSPDLPSPPSYSPSEATASDVTGELEKSGGMSGGKKAGVALGFIAAACFVGFGGLVYRKRQQNIRRAQYSQSARLEFF